MERSKDFELACQLQADNFKEASRFGLECNRAIYTAAKLASAETPDTFQGQVVSAGTGTGKTTFALSLIAERIGTDPNYTAAFVTPTIDAAQNAYDALNTMLPTEEIAVHSSAHSSASEAVKKGGPIQRYIEVNGPSNRDSLAKARVAICTHEAWLGEGLSDSSHGVRYHTTGARKNVFVDEFPDTVRVQDISASDLVELANEFERHSDTRNLADVITQFATSPSDTTDGKCARYWLVKTLTDLDNVALNSFDTKRLGTAAAPERCKTALNALKKAASGHSFWTRTGASKEDNALGHKRLVTFTSVFRPHPGMIILDATADYALGAADLNTVAVPKVLYPKMQVSHIDGPRELHGLHVTRLNANNLRIYAKWIITVVRDHSDTSEPSLVVVHKGVEEHVRAALNSEMAGTEQMLLTHWGCDVGSNKYRDCKTVFLFSEFYHPRHVYLAKALGSTGSQATEHTLKQATGQRSTGSVSGVEEAHLLRQFKQMACRGSARCVDDNGNAAPMQIITSMDQPRLLRSLHELFPGAPSPLSIASPNAKKPTKGGTLVHYLLGSMKAKKGTKLCSTKVCKDTGIAPKDLKRVFKSRECCYLELFGWSFVPGAGRRSKPFLTCSTTDVSQEAAACAA